MRLPTRKKELDNQQLKGDDGPVYLTKAGKEKIEHQLIDLKKQHVQAVKDVQTTGEFGDFSENAEYQEAKHRMRHLAARMTTLSEKLKRVVLIEKEQDGKIGLGSTVTLKMNNRTLAFELVGPHEANPMQGRLSHVSPLGSHLIGHKVGETISVETMGDVLTYEILRVE